MCALFIRTPFYEIKYVILHSSINAHLLENPKNRNVFDFQFAAISVSLQTPKGKIVCFFLFFHFLIAKISYHRATIYCFSVHGRVSCIYVLSCIRSWRKYENINYLDFFFERSMAQMLRHEISPIFLQLPRTLCLSNSDVKSCLIWKRKKEIPVALTFIKVVRVWK